MAPFGNACNCFPGSVWIICNGSINYSSPFVFSLVNLVTHKWRPEEVADISVG